jgi:hypothetical protein
LGTFKPPPTPSPANTIANNAVVKETRRNVV